MGVKEKAIKPIFIFSLPRSGSTLAQRMLSLHAEIATVSETWLLLPLIYSMKTDGVFTEYYHDTAVEALADFWERLPNGKKDYCNELATMSLQLYRKAAKQDAAYFLDKTPRYHLIIDEIIELFPDAKFLFLWRNPLAVAASMIETFSKDKSKGKWNLWHFKVDLYKGVENLVRASEQYQERIYVIRYEDMLAEPDKVCRGVFNYLELESDGVAIQGFSEVQLDGKMGDPTGVKEYQSISLRPLDKWKGVLANPLRKIWCRRYLKWLGGKRLAVMGYNLDELIGDLDKIPFSVRHVGSDAIRMAYGAVTSLLDLGISRRKIKRMSDWRHLYPYG